MEDAKSPRSLAVDVTPESVKRAKEMMLDLGVYCDACGVHSIECREVEPGENLCPACVPKEM